MKTLQDINAFQTFLGDRVGIALVRNGDEDDHIMFVPLYELGGDWHTGIERLSSHWIPELLLQLRWAMNWMKENGEKDISDSPETQGMQFGWRYKDPEKADSIANYHAVVFRGLE